MAAAWAIVSAWGTNVAYRAAAVVLAALYVATFSISSFRAARWWWELSEETAMIVDGVRQVREKNAEKTILLSGVPGKVFWNGVYYGCFAAAGLDNVYLTPESRQAIGQDAELGDPSRFFLASNVIADAFAHSRILVFAVDGARFRNITSFYKLIALPAGAVPVPDSVVK